MHLVFNDLDMLRRFNIYVGKKKSWLPSDYGYTEKRNKDVATRDNIRNIVQRYNQDKETVTNQIMDFYKNYKKVSKYLTLA